jgi:predicted metal-dependent HD superfamily phosphohydrolase
MKNASRQYAPKFNTGFKSWCSLWNELGCNSPDKGLYERLVNVYCEPERQYHTLIHLEECMTYLSDVRLLCCQQAEVGISLWFHDAVYNPHQDDNEEQSARWAEQAAQEHGMGQNVSQRIRDLVLTTKHRVQPIEQDAQILNDIDLSILGSSAERFSEYELQVRQEYSWMPEADFRAGRQHILEALLSRRAIYCTEYFWDLLEEKARSNLGRSLGGQTSVT